MPSGAQKHLENDEPLFLSSEEEDEDVEGEADVCLPADRQPGCSPVALPGSEPSDRLVHGHTPFDLAKSQKVSDAITCLHWGIVRVCACVTVHAGMCLCMRGCV